MTRSPEEEEEKKEDDEFKHLHHEWSSSKKSPQSAIVSQFGSAEIVQLLDATPRELISSLQKLPFSSSGWKVRTNHLAVEDAIRERRAAIKRRRLFDSFESCGQSDFEEEEKCSSYVSSSIMIHGSEAMRARTLCCSLSCEDNGDEADEVGGGVCEESMEKEEVLLSGIEKDGIAFGMVHRLGWMVRISWIAFAVVVFALVIISGNSFDESVDGDRLIPT